MSIDEMVAALLKEKKDEIKHKDFCVDAFAENDKNNAMKQRSADDQKAKERESREREDSGPTTKSGQFNSRQS